MYMFKKIFDIIDYILYNVICNIICFIIIRKIIREKDNLRKIVLQHFILYSKSINETRHL